MIILKNNLENMRQSLKNEIKKLELTKEGKSLGVLEINQFNSFWASLNHVSVVYRCLGENYICNQYNTCIDNIPILSVYFHVL